MDDCRYFKTVLACTLLLFLILTAALWIIPTDKYLGAYYSHFVQQKDYIHQNGQQSEILFLGDSALKASILPEQVNQNAYNLSIPAGTPIEMYYSLKTYLQCHPKPKEVFIGFAPYHYSDKERYKTWMMYNHYLSWGEIWQSQWIIFTHDHIPWADRPGELWEDLQYMLRIPTKYYQTLKTNRLKMRHYNRELYEEIASAKGYRTYEQDPPDWRDHFVPYPMFLTEYRPLNSLDFYMKKLLHLCIDNQIPVHVIQLPIHQLTMNVMEKNVGFLPAYHAYLERLANETGVEIERDMPVYDLSLFADSLHLNRQGAEIYTKELVERYHLK